MGLLTKAVSIKEWGFTNEAEAVEDICKRGVMFAVVYDAPTKEIHAHEISFTLSDDAEYDHERDSSALWHKFDAMFKKRGKILLRLDDKEKYWTIH